MEAYGRRDEHQCGRQRRCIAFQCLEREVERQRGILEQRQAAQEAGRDALERARARVEEEDFNGTVGVALRAAFVRTWGNPVGTQPGLSYLGPELDLSIVRVNTTLGVLWRVSGSGGKSVLFSWGFGFGF